MEELPLISIIMPSYNSGKYIGYSIQSIMSQTYSSWELIVIDGGSDDSTKLTVESLQSVDPRITFIDNSSVDNGPAHARGLGIKCAKGMYIAFIDSDDLWAPEKLMKQVNFMQVNNILFSYTLYRQLLSNGSYMSPSLYACPTYSFPEYLGCRGIGNLTVMVRADLFTPEVLNIYQFRAEDTIWWLLIMKKGVVAYLFPEALAFYRITPGSLSSQKFMNQKAVWRAYREVFNLSIINTFFYYFSYIFNVLFIRSLILPSLLMGRFSGKKNVE